MIKLSLTVQYASQAASLPTRPQLRRWIKAALQRDAQVTLRIVDEAEGRLLNKNYRGKDYATNVLTFDYAEQPGLDDELCGDVVICAPVVEREAQELCCDRLAHYAHLCLHAALHLQGYEHENDAEATQMEALESALMLKLHYNDPYQATNG